MLVQVKNYNDRSNCWWNTAASKTTRRAGSLDTLLSFAGRLNAVAPDNTSWTVDRAWGQSRTFEALGTIS